MAGLETVGVYRVSIQVCFPSENTKKGEVCRALNVYDIPFTPGNANALNEVAKLLKGLTETGSG